MNYFLIFIFSIASTKMFSIRWMIRRDRKKWFATVWRGFTSIVNQSDICILNWSFHLLHIQSTNAIWKWSNEIVSLFRWALLFYHWFDSSITVDFVQMELFSRCHSHHLLTWSSDGVTSRSSCQTIGDKIGSNRKS
jgi:hypothetical protein